MDELLVTRLGSIGGLEFRRDARLSEYTRFGIGGAADLLVDAHTNASMIAALDAIRGSGVAFEVIGDGTNLIVSDAGFRGIILRYRGSAIRVDGVTVEVEAGAVLQMLVDETIANGLAGVHTMTGIPGSVGAAVYGNAGAYGRSISQSVRSVSYYDGSSVGELSNAQCEFQYRESIFKKNKSWIILSTELLLEAGDATELRANAERIRKIRDEKYPPTMRCAGSIFKNLVLGELEGGVQSRVPANVVREGKVPAAWFLDEAGVKGMRIGGIHVADYHANLIYNSGGGTAAELCEVIRNCKRGVEDRFGLVLEEEVQYIGEGLV
ncbi:MAG TPA: UDP-N-acetylmuramate dehydrogenase [Bryobacteraceae bacterium]|jgi:UDP-N-acetylmuramate dehydrogenase